MAASSTIRVKREQFLDPRWRLSNLYWITDKAGRAVQFVPNSAQLKFLDEVHTLNLILKARQDWTMLCSAAMWRWCERRHDGEQLLGGGRALGDLRPRLEAA